MSASHPCTACGRHRFPAPVVCYWCRTGRPVLALNPSPPKPPAPACSSCGGGLQAGEEDGALCWSCRHYRAAA